MVNYAPLRIKKSMGKNFNKQSTLLCFSLLTLWALRVPAALDIAGSALEILSGRSVNTRRQGGILSHRYVKTLDVSIFADPMLD